jgi:hypothetical protein
VIDSVGYLITSIRTLAVVPIDCPSSTAAEINRTTLHERTAIIDPNYHRPAVSGVRNSNPRSEAERPVRGGHGTGIEPLPRRRSSSREFFTIIRGNLRLGGARQIRERT